MAKTDPPGKSNPPKRDPGAEMDFRIEVTKQRVGVGELDQKERRKLFNQFIAHGGKVVGGVSAGSSGLTRPVAPRPGGAVPRNAASGGNAAGRTQGTTRDAGRGTGAAGGREGAAREVAGGSPALFAGPRRDVFVEKPKLADLLRIRLEGMRLRVFTLAGTRLHEKFVRLVRLEMGERLKEMHLALGSILQGEVSVINEIRKASTGDNSNFFEVLLRLDALYDEKEFAAIQGALSGRRVPESDALPLMRRFFKKMYILSEFRPVCRMCALKAVRIQGRDGRVHREALLALEDQLTRAVDFVLGECCPRFHLLLCRMVRRYIPPHTRELDEFLGVTKEDVLGYITLMQRKRRIEELKKLRAGGEPSRQAERHADAESPPVSPRIESGLSLIRSSIERYEIMCGGDTLNQVVLLGDKDPLYRPLMLLDIFDREYSFILTAGKISFNIDYRGQKRINVKEELGYAYLLLNETWEEAKTYFTAVGELRESVGDMRLTPYQKFLVEKTMERKRAVAGRRLKDRIVEVMRMIEQALDVVIADYNLNGRLIQNPDLVLLFDANVDGSKKVHGKKVIEAVMEAFLFAATVPFLVESPGPHPAAGRPPSPPREG